MANFIVFEYSLDKYGNVETSIQLRPWWAIGNIDALTWEATNGRLIFTTSYSAEYDFTYYESNADSGVGSHDSLHLANATFYRVHGTEGDSLIGVWSDSFAEGAMSYYTFNEDGTGFFANDKFIYWNSDGEKIRMFYDLNNTFDYSVSGDFLQLFFSDRSMYFTRVDY